LVGCQRLLRALKFLGQLFADDRHLGRRIDPDSNTAMANFNHGHADLISDQYALAYFSTEN
jgi:hypothetical protein